MNFSFQRSAFASSFAAAIATLLPVTLCAQVNASAAGDPLVLKEAPITITANPLGASDLIAPSAAYAGTGLLVRLQSTLGETLASTPGVSSTYFGPNASRPIIRGLDGDRVRVLQNSGASIDASGLSYDHAVPLDPIAVERIEVLRGPGALLYGGSAVGGVVNVIDNRIAQTQRVGLNGGTTFGLSGGNNGQHGAFKLAWGGESMALHADAFSRTSGDVAVPIELACGKTGSPARAKKICNSSATAQGAAAGATVFFPGGHLGASFASFKTNYGTVAEDEVTIDMRSDRLTVQGQTELGGWLRSVKGQASTSDYQHTEFEGADVGTVFKNKGSDLRLELRHAKLGAFEGVWGLQTESTRFSADGDEAFAPYSKTGQAALFAYEEAAFAWGKLSVGARTERVNVSSLGNPQVTRFVVADRRFTARSYAVGSLVNVSPGWALSGNLSSTQRAPKDYELFANGPHIATGAFEVGSASLALERSTNVDLGVKWQQGAHNAQMSAYVNRFKNYILLDATGQLRGTDGEQNPTDADEDGLSDSSGAELLPEFAYTPVAARFRGFEASGNWRLQDGASTLDLQWRVDTVRATNSATGADLPRIAPLRVGTTWVLAQGSWSLRGGFDHHAKPRGNTSEAYTLWNAAATYRQRASSSVLTYFARLENAGNKLAYSATSILTQSAPGKAPLPGRHIKVGLQATF